MRGRTSEPDHPNVMVSSTYADLIEHREAVVEALLRLGFFAVGMEFDSAKAGQDVIDSSLAMVDKAQAYIGLISHRYGGVPKDAARNPEQLSITELEYRAALKRGIPVYMFLMSDDHPIKRADVEAVEAYQAKLKRLRDDARSRSITAEFSSVGELESRVLQSMAELRRQLDQSARVAEAAEDQPRAKQEWQLPAPPALLAIPNFTSGHAFVGRRAELAWLDQWAASDDPLLILEAIGGMGKSTLAWQWLSGAAGGRFTGVLWYSFYEGGADMAAFAAYALAYTTGRPLKEFLGRHTADLARGLIPALRARPFLLVLDGLERVLAAYHRLDAAQARDDQVDAEHSARDCIKPSDADLLRQLVAVRPSKILITSRLMPTALTNKTGQPLPGVRHRELRGLHSDDALRMLHEAGVRGDEGAIRRYLQQNFDNHPLMIGIIAGLVNDYFREPGAFDRWADDPLGGAALNLAQLDLSQRRTHILAAALNGLKSGNRQLLSRIAALSAAVPFETVEALSPFLPPLPPRKSESAEYEAFKLKSLQNFLKRTSSAKERGEIEQLQARIEQAEAAYQQAMEQYNASDEVQQALPKLVAALKDLQQRGLLQWDRAKNIYDLHPVVRGYAFDILEQNERADISNRIVDHFQSKSPDVYANAKTLADVQQSIIIFRALVQARRFGEAVSFYNGPFARALLFSIGMPYEILALLKPLFPSGFHTLPAVLKSKDDQASILNNVGFAFYHVSQYAHAREAFTSAFQIRLGTRDLVNASTILRNLAAVSFAEGRIAASFSVLQLGLDLAEVMEESDQRAISQLHMMGHCFETGQFERAEVAYEAFRRLPPPRDPALYRSGDAETMLCWMQFYQYQLTQDQLDEAETIAHHGSRSTKTGLARLRGELALQRSETALAIRAFERAIVMNHEVGRPVTDLEACFALAKALAGQHNQARDICDRLHKLARPPHAELARAYLELGEVELAREHALTGYRWSWADGPPHVRWRALEQCRAVLKQLGAAEPKLPPFDPQAVPPLPFEQEIRQLIEKLRQEKKRRKS